VMLSGKSDGGEGGGRRAAAPAAAAGGSREAAGKAKEGAEKPFGDYPEALDEEDDDLPF
jgi:hypothetical protein